MIPKEMKYNLHYDSLVRSHRDEKNIRLGYVSPGQEKCKARRGSTIGFHLLWHTVELAMCTRLCLL